MTTADGERARELALEAQRLLSDLSTTALDWALHAGRWLAIGDRDTGHDYLRHARAAAATVEDLCTIATIDGDLRPLEGRETGAWWHVAYVQAWVAGDREAARATLERGWANATRFDHARAILDERDGHLPTDLAHLETLAVTWRDWLELGALWHAIYDPERTRAVTDRALALAREAPHERRDPYAPNDLSRAEHITRYRRGEWLADTALEHPTPRFRPHEILDGLGRIAPGYHGDADRLFDRLRADLTPAQRQAIASNDYGLNDVALDDLEQIVGGGRLAHPNSAAREELELERWASGSSVDHIARAFASCILCIDGAGPSTGDLTGGNIESAVPTLLESCLALGPWHVAAARDLLLAMTEAHLGRCAQRLFVELGAIVAARAVDPIDPRVPAMLRRLTDDEAEIGASSVAHPYRNTFLLRSSNFSQRHDLFAKLAATTVPELDLSRSDP